MQRQSKPRSRAPLAVAVPLLLMLAGSACCEEDGDDVTLVAGDSVVIEPGTAAAVVDSVVIEPGARRTVRVFAR